MVSTISPVVYRNTSLGRSAWLIAAATYTLGSATGGILAGALFSLAGYLLTLFLDADRNIFPLLVGLLAIGYALHELRLVSLPHPQRKHQVPAHWRYKFHPYMTAGLFGLLLGIGFITYIPTATYYVLGMAVILYGSPMMGILIFAIYGVARALLLWPLSWQNTIPGRVERLTDFMDLTKPIMRQINGFALATAGAYLISAYL